MNWPATRFMNAADTMGRIDLAMLPRFFLLCRCSINRTPIRQMATYRGASYCGATATSNAGCGGKPFLSLAMGISTNCRMAHAYPKTKGADTRQAESMPNPNFCSTVLMTHKWIKYMA